MLTPTARQACDACHMTITSINDTVARGMGVAVDHAPPHDLVGEAPPSPAGPLDDAAGHLSAPPLIALPRAIQVLRFNQRQIEFVFGARRRLGEVFRMLSTDE